MPLSKFGVDVIWWIFGGLQNVPLRFWRRTLLPDGLRCCTLQFITALSPRPHCPVHLCLASPGGEGCPPLDGCLLVSSTQPSFLPFSRVGSASQPYPFSCPWPLSHCRTVAPLTNVLYVKSSSCHMACCALKLTDSAEGGI